MGGFAVNFPLNQAIENHLQQKTAEDPVPEAPGRSAHGQ